MNQDTPVLLVGEVFVDFTVGSNTESSKLRLGGIVHAARGFWSVGASFAVAAICPSYLVEQVRGYLAELGCSQFIWLAEVIGAPNVMTIGDPLELADQGYQDLLRDEKAVRYNDDQHKLSDFRRCLIFPGKYSLPELRSKFGDEASFIFDIAYDVSDLGALAPYAGKITSILTSTSSPFFLENQKASFQEFGEKFEGCNPSSIILKENRGGSRLLTVSQTRVEEIPALLGKTVNSVGVGDVYSAVFAWYEAQDPLRAAWLASRAAACYAQTTFPDDFRRDTQRCLKVPVKTMRELGGTNLPWHERKDYQIYFAAPDFSYVERKRIDEAIDALKYHNFKLRRPIVENGELAKNSERHEIDETYHRDYALLLKCDVVFAVPQFRDPGTLVEMGMAIQAGIPVITYDPNLENDNTMVIAGSHTHSNDLDECLNGLFCSLSDIRKERA